MISSEVGVEGCVCELKKREKTSHLAFLDVSKAYDNV